MKTVELFHLPDCPYCIKAEKAIRELIDEDPDYARINVRWINERAEADYADTKDYYYVPSIFFEGEKLYEADPGQKYEDIKACIRAAFDRVLSV